MLTLITLNACGLSRDSLEDFLDNTSVDSPNWGIAFLQELSAPSVDGFVSQDAADTRSFHGDEKLPFLLATAAGHLVVCGSSPWRCSAIAVHRNVVPSLLSSTVSPFPAVVLRLDAWSCAFCSAHLLASHYDDHYFVDVRNAFSSCSMELSRATKNCFVGMDANAQFGPTCTSPSVGPFLSGTLHGLRQGLLSTLADTYGPFFANTHMLRFPEDLVIHIPWNSQSRHSHSQIDYILVPNGFQVSGDGAYSAMLPVASDHKAVVLNVAISANAKRMAFRGSQKFWYLPPSPRS